MNKKILVTGAGGYLGQHLIKYLVAQNYYVRSAISTKNQVKFNQPIEIVSGDITDYEYIKKICMNVETIIHLAAVPFSDCETDARYCNAVNVTATESLLRAGIENKISKFIFLSTIHVYSNLNHDVTELSGVSPKNNYTSSKLAAEGICRKYSHNMQVFILRLSNVYGVPLGKNGWNLVVNELCKNAVLDKKIVLNTSGLQKRNFIYVEDFMLAMGFLIKLKKEENGYHVLNLGGLDNYSILDIGKIIQKSYFELFSEKIPIKRKDQIQSSMSNDFNFNSDKISLLGFRLKHKLVNEIKTMLVEIKKQ